PDRAARGRPGRQGDAEPPDRRDAVHQRGHGGGPPHPHVPQAGHFVPERAHPFGDGGVHPDVIRFLAGPASGVRTKNSPRIPAMFPKVRSLVKPFRDLIRIPFLGEDSPADRPTGWTLPRHGRWVGGTWARARSTERSTSFEGATGLRTLGRWT